MYHRHLGHPLRGDVDKSVPEPNPFNGSTEDGLTFVTLNISPY